MRGVGQADRRAGRPGSARPVGEGPAISAPPPGAGPAVAAQRIWLVKTFNFDGGNLTRSRRTVLARFCVLSSRGASGSRWPWLLIHLRRRRLSICSFGPATADAATLA